MPYYLLMSLHLLGATIWIGGHIVLVTIISIVFLVIGVGIRTRGVCLMRAIGRVQLPGTQIHEA